MALRLTFESSPTKAKSNLPPGQRFETPEEIMSGHRVN